MKNALRLSVPVIFSILAFGASAPLAFAANSWAVNASNSDDNLCVATTFQCKTIQAAVTAAASDDTINVAAGTYTITSAININKKLTLQGEAGANIETSGGNNVFLISGAGTGSTLDGFHFTKTDTAGQVMIAIQSNDVTIKNNEFNGNWSIGDGPTIRALEISSVTGFDVNNNSFDHLRQPAYVNAATGKVTSNSTGNTKGWVIVSRSDVNFTNNTWGTNVLDIAIVKDNPVGANNYPDSRVVSMSDNNNDAVVETQYGATNLLSDSYVTETSNGKVGDTGSKWNPYTSVQNGINRVVEGGTVHVAAGNYAEHLTINKSISLIGVDKTTTIIDGGGTGVVVTITASNVTLNGFTIRNSGINIATDAGIGLVGPGTSITGVTIENDIVTNNATGIAVLGANSSTLKDNAITNNARYGIVFDASPYGATLFSTTNTISGNTITTSGRDGIYVGQHSDGQIIKDNYISGATGTLEDGNYEGDGIYFWKSSGNTVTNNHIFDNKATNNTDTTANGIEMMGSNNNIITGNSITGNQKGLLVRRSNSESFFPNTFSGNTISGNTEYGVSTDFTESDGPFIATSNYWGTASGPSDVGPGTGDKVGTNVSYSPWWVTSSGTDSVVPSAPTLHEITSPTNNVRPTFVWNAVTATPSVTSYHLVVTNSDTSATAIDQTAATGFIPASDLPGGNYTWKVLAHNSMGNGDYSTINSFTIDMAAPVISKLTLTATANSRKINDTVTLTITADAAGYTAGAITINGVAATGFASAGGNNYTATYTVVPGNTDRLAGTVPASVMLTDAAGNSNEAFTMADANSISVDANVPATPVISSIATDNRINNSEKVTVAVVGTAEAGSTVNVSLSDAGNAHTVLGSGVATDGGSYSIVIDTTTLNDGTITPSITVTDVADNTSTAAITPTASKDTVAPVITAHDPVVEEATSHSGATVNYTLPTTSDVIDGAGTATCLPASGTVFALTTTVVNCNASDAAGNAANPTTFNVTVQDTIAPTIDSVSDIIAEATSVAGATVTITPPTSHDAVDGNLPASCDASTGVFALGDHTVTCSKTDAAGHAANPVTFHVTVHDTTAPVIAVHADVTKESAAGTSMAVTYTAPNATDNVDSIAAATCTPASGTTFAMGNTTVTCSKTDAAGHAATATTFIVHVVDTTAPATPTISTPAQTVNTGTIDIAGAAEANSTVTVTGGASTATHAATGGFYNITVTLTHNAVNNLSVTAKDASNNVSSPATVAITHDDTSLAPVSFAAGSPTLTTIALSWTNNELNGSYYTIKSSTSEITAGNFDAASFLSSGPAVALGAQGYTAKNLTAGTTYYFAIEMTDAVGNVSDIATTSGTTASAGASASSDVTAPTAVIDLSLEAGPIETSQIVLNWSATGDDGSTGIASKYVIKRSLSAITADNFDSATTVFNSISPSASSSPETLTVSGLTANTTYYFAIKVQDEVPNTSTISNVEYATTANNLPTVTNVNPTTNQNDSTQPITVTGTNFVDSATTVRFTNSSNTFDLVGSRVSDTSVTANVPIGAPAGEYHLRVIDANGTSDVSASIYTVTAAPAMPSVTDVVPSNIGNNDADVNIEIYGTGFTGVDPATGVVLKYGDVMKTLISVIVVSDTKITATIPGTLSAGTYNVTVTNGSLANAVSAVQITVVAPVPIASSATQDVVTENPINMVGDNNIIPVQVTLNSNTDNSTLDNNTTIAVVIPPATTLTDVNGDPYIGNINPPQLVKPTEEIAAAAGDNAIVITMGNPNETINFSQNFVTTVTLETTQSTAPIIWYYNQSSGLSIAGIDGTQDGVHYVPGGTLLNTVSNDGMYTYTIGLLLNHMSSYVAGVKPTISDISPSGVAGTSMTITGTNFSPGAVVKFGDTSASVTANDVTQLTVTVPSISNGSYSIKVTNTDTLEATSLTSFKIVAASRSASSGGGPRCVAGTSYNPSTSSCTPIGQVLGASTGPATTHLVGCVPGSGDLFDVTNGKSCTVSATPATPSTNSNGNANGNANGRVLGASTFNFTRNLAVGSRGTDVIELQKILITKGLLKISAPTNYFGQLTRTGVIAYQKEHGIAQVGNTGPLTRAELNKEGAVQTTFESSGSSLTAEQVSSIVALIESFGADAATMDKIRAALAK